MNEKKTGQKRRRKAPRKKSSDNKPPRIIIDEIIVKYAVDGNLFRLESTNLKKKIQPLFFLGFYTEGLLSGGFCPGTFCRGPFDLEPMSHGMIVLLHTERL